jgi:hypothetical protein
LAAFLFLGNPTAWENQIQSGFQTSTGNAPACSTAPINRHALTSTRGSLNGTPGTQPTHAPQPSGG